MFRHLPRGNVYSWFISQNGVSVEAEMKSSSRQEVSMMDCQCGVCALDKSQYHMREDDAPDT